MPARRVLTVSVALLAAVALVTGTAASGNAAAPDPARPAAQQITGGGPGQYRYIVRVDGSEDLARTAVGQAGGTVVSSQPRIGTLVADLTPAGAAALHNAAGVRGVTADVPVQAQSLGFNPATQGGSMTNITRLTGAQAMWKKGFTGAGVDIAILDTGVAPVSGLTSPEKVFVGPDLSFESQDTDTRYLDSYGHGTNMAGLIAGREGAKSTGTAYAADTTNFYGMAPDARLIPIKVADHAGAVDVSQVIAGIDWVIYSRYSNGLNIRVLNISYGNISANDPQSDPVSWAAESAWKAGIVVVASAGNDGSAAAGVASPGFNPWIITVGGADTKGTDTYADDTVAAFSQVGDATHRGPDLVAPAVGVVSLGVPGSYLASTYPAAKVGNNFLRGSGTSQAAAITAGGIALLLQQFPYAAPNDVKALLRTSAHAIAGTTTAYQRGGGELNLAQATTLYPDTTSSQSVPKGNGNGLLNKARGGNYVTIGGVALTGEKDILGTPWNSAVQAAQIADGTVWTWDGKFNGVAWIGTAGYTADTTSWAGKTWQGKTWQGNGWAGKSWQTGIWLGTGWSSATWGGPVSSPTWASKAWFSGGWK